MFSDTAKFSQSTVFNLQASDYVQREEEEGTNPNVSLHMYTSLDFFLINKVDFFFHL